MLGGVLLALTLGGQNDAQAGIADVTIPGLATVAVGSGGGYVDVFAIDLLPMKRYQNPNGCVTLEPAAHVLLNHTGLPVMVYAGSPNCSVLSIPYVVASGAGVHVPPALSSFQAVGVKKPAKAKSTKRHAKR